MTSRILYVEDDPVQATLVKHVLEDAEFSTFHVANGFDAIQALKSSRFDGVLTDHYMPNMSGVELIAQIKELDISVPVVVLTAASDISLAFSALRSGAADFISKDSDGQYLSIIPHVLQRSIDEYQLKDRARQLTEKLEQEKRISYTTLDSLTQGVVVLSRDKTIMYCNRYFRQLFSLTDQEVQLDQDIKWLSSCMAAVGLVQGKGRLREVYSLVSELVAGGRDHLEIDCQAKVLELKCTNLDSQGFALTFTDITHQKDQQNALAKIIDLAPVAMLAVDEGGEIVLANQRATDLIGLNLDEILHSKVGRFVPDEARNQHQELIRNYFGNSEPRQMQQGRDLQMISGSGAAIPVEISLSGVEISGNSRVLATIVDITQRKQAENALRRAHELTQSIIENSPFSMVATDEKGTIIAVSPALEKLLWYKKDDLIHQHNATVFHEQGELETRAAMLSEELGEPISAGMESLVIRASRGVVEGTEWTYVRKDGSRLPVNLTVTTLRSADGQTSGFLFVAYDITEQRRAREYIEHIAHHDELTGLPNRSLMQDRLKLELLRVKRRGRKIGILVLDLDHFKRINDSLGHMAGDQLLKTVAERLIMAVRETDTVCRMGGDEFVVLLPEIDGPEDVERVCQKIIELIGKPVVVGLNSLSVTPSIGISIAPEDGTTPEHLIKHADIAMYHAKKRGRNGYQTFSQDLAASSMESLAIEQALHEALKKEKLSVFYQPQVDLNTGEVCGFEALIRWYDDERGNIPPDQFIPMAETTGFITAIGEWVLSRACSDIQQLRLAHGKDYRIAVNVSPRQFEHPNFVGTVRAALKSSGLPQKALELEITEGLLVSDSELVVSKLNALSQLGVLLAIDDFGTGYSSLAYVSKYPVDCIKIDRSFMSLQDKANVAIVSAISAIADGLSLEVVAEGIETAEQLDFVSKRGCHVIQGYYFSPAVGIDHLDEVIENINHTSDTHYKTSQRG